MRFLECEFPTPSIEAKAVSFLQIRAADLGLGHPHRLGLHALRRGAARELVSKGWNLGTLLTVGG